MNRLLLTGVSIVILALVSYSVAFIAQLRNHRPTSLLRGFLTAGVALDITATAFMIAGSRRFPLTFHGIWGYSALVMMAIDMGLIWKRFRARHSESLPSWLRRYSIFAYSWWVLAFLAGILLVLID
jgi:hypothetical protein